MAQVFSSVKPQFSLTGRPAISQPQAGNGFQTTTPSLGNALNSKINPAPLKPIISPSKPIVSTKTAVSSPTASTGYKNPFMGASGATNTQAVQSPAPQAPTSNLNPAAIDYSSQEDPYQKATRALANAQQGNATSNAAASGLLGIARDGSQAVQQATSNIRGLQQTQAEIANNPNVASEVASGRGQALTGQIQAAETGLSNALQGQGQQITAGSNAGSIGNTQQSNQIGAQSAAGNLAAPQSGAAFFGSPTTGGLVGGNTGSNGATGNSLIDSSVQAAVAKYKAGGNINDARASLSSLGQPALNAFDQAINGGSYNPTALGASANATAAGVAGNVEDTQSISGAQNNIDSITQLIQNSPELNKSGLNIKNAGYALLQKNLSSSDRSTLDNALGSINSALSKVTGAPVDIGHLSTQQGTSLLTTINNQVQLAKGIAQGKLPAKTTSPQSSGGGGLFDF